MKGILCRGGGHFLLVAVWISWGGDNYERKVGEPGGHRWFCWLTFLQPQDGRGPASSQGAFPSMDAGGRKYIAAPEGFLEV